MNSQLKKMLILLAISAGAYGWYYYGASPYDSLATTGSGDIVIEKGVGRFFFGELGDVSIDVRLFGKEDGMFCVAGEDFGVVPFALIAVPERGQAKDFMKYLCTVSSTSKAARVNIIPESSRLLRKLESLPKKAKNGDICLSVAGKSLYLKKADYRGKGDEYYREATKYYLQNVVGGGRFNEDPRKFVLASSLKETGCL